MAITNARRRWGRVWTAVPASRATRDMAREFKKKDGIVPYGDASRREKAREEEEEEEV